MPGKVIVGKRLDTGKPLLFSLSPGYHQLNGGLTGFGKSNQLNYLIYQGAFFPDVQFVLCNATLKPDFLQWLPRASGVAIGAKSTEQALDAVLEIMIERYKDLLPVNVKNHLTMKTAVDIALSSERSVHIDNDTPLIVFIIDDFVELFKSGVRGNVNRRTEKLHTAITIGRAAGLQVILATQRPSQMVAATDLRENMPFKIGFALDQNGLQMIFGIQGRDIDPYALTVPGMGNAVVDGERSYIPFIAPECPESACADRAIMTSYLRKELKQLPHWYSDDLM